MLLRFQGKFENVLICFLYRVYFYIGSDLIFFNQDLNYKKVRIIFSDLKCGTSVLREPNHDCLVHVVGSQYP